MAKLGCMLTLMAALAGLLTAEAGAGILPGPLRCNLTATSLGQTLNVVLFINPEEVFRDPADPALGVMVFAFGRNLTRGSGVSVEFWVPPTGGSEIMARESPGAASPFLRGWQVTCGPNLGLPCNGNVVDAGPGGTFTAPVIVTGFACVPAVDP